MIEQDTKYAKGLYETIKANVPDFSFKDNEQGFYDKLKSDSLYADGVYKTIEANVPDFSFKGNQKGFMDKVGFSSKPQKGGDLPLTKDVGNAFGVPDFQKSDTPKPQNEIPDGVHIESRVGLTNIFGTDEVNLPLTKAWYKYSKDDKGWIYEVPKDGKWYSVGDERNKELNEEYFNQKAKSKSATPETIMADGSQTKPIKQTQDPINQNFEWSKGVSTQQPRTEAERVENETTNKENKENKLGAVVADIKKRGGGSETEAQLLTYNNYDAAKQEAAKRIKDEINSGMEAKVAELQQAAQDRMSKNPLIQKVINDTQNLYSESIQKGMPKEQAVATAEKYRQEALNTPEIKALTEKENNILNAESELWVKEKLRGETKFFKDGLPKVFNDVLHSKTFLESTNDDKRQLITQMWGTVEKRMLTNKRDPKTIAEAKKDFYYKAMEQASFNEDMQLTPLALKDYAQANLPKLQEVEAKLKADLDAAAKSDNPSEAKSLAISSEYNNAKLARQNMEDIIDMPDAAHGGFLKGFKDGTSIPFVSSILDAVDNYSLYNIAKKAQAGKELSEAEQSRLATEGMVSQYKQQAEPSSEYNIGQSTAGSLIFMGELAATGGINSGVAKGVEKIVMGKLAKVAGEAAVNTARYQLLAKPLMGILGAGAQTLANPQMYLKNATERILPSFQVALSPDGDKLVGTLDWATQNQRGYNTGKGEDAGTALARGLGTTFSDIFSESVFRALPGITDPMKKAALQKLVQNSELSKRLFIGYYMAKEGLDAGGVYARLRKGGVPIDGLVDEMLENIVNEGMTNFITGDNRVANAMLKDDDSFDWKKLKENAISTGLMTGVLGLAGKAMQGGKGKTMVVNVQDRNGLASNLDVSEKTVDFITNSLTDKGFLETKQWAKQNIGRIKPEEREAAMSIINGYAGKPIFLNANIAMQGWVKDIKKQVAELPQDDNSEAENDFIHTVGQTGDAPTITVEMADGDIQVVDNLPQFLVENKEDIANGDISITIDNTTPEMKMVVNAAINGSDTEFQDAMKEYSITSPPIPIEEQPKSEVVEFSGDEVKPIRQQTVVSDNVGVPENQVANTDEILALLSKSDKKGVDRINRRVEASGMSLIDATKEYLENYPSLSGKGNNRFEELQIIASESKSKSGTQNESTNSETGVTGTDNPILEVPKEQEVQQVSEEVKVGDEKQVEENVKNKDVPEVDATQKSGTPKSEDTIKKLEQERDTEIENTIKPKLKIEFIKAEDLVNSRDPIANKEKHNEYKERFKSIKRLIDCL